MTAAAPLQTLLNDLLVAAASDGNHRTAHVLLRHGADPRDGIALVEAASAGHVEIVSLLLAAGAPVGIDNDTPLQSAAYSGHADVIAVLLANGADPSPHDHLALRYAESRGHGEAAQVLRAAGSYNPLDPDDGPLARFARVRDSLKPH